MRSVPMLTEAGQPFVTPETQVRRAWVVVGVAFTIFVSLTVAAAAGGLWVYRHATEPETATLEVLSGDGALIRSPSDNNWRLITRRTRVREGDRVSTALGTVVRLTMFDGSTIEVTEDTEVRIARMRSSRFLHRTKLVVVEPQRGMVYVGMVPRGDYRYSETIVRGALSSVTMADGDGQADAGSFLVEVRSGPGTTPGERIAVLTGAVKVTTGADTMRLTGEQQVNIGADGDASVPEQAVRDLIVNGDFRDGLNGWVEFQDDTDGSSGNGSQGAAVERVPAETTQGDAIAVEFLRSATDGDRVTTGIRQRIGKTLRVHSSLVLEFEVKISDQLPPSTSENPEAFPLVVEVNYLDLNGTEQRWRHGYYILEATAANVPDEMATAIDRGTWQRVVFDLRNLEPVPRQVTSIVVYASGQRYATQVANLSLSSSELVDPNP
jgi:hypothetical protein